MENAELKKQIINFFCDGNQHRECRNCDQLIKQNNDYKEQMQIIKLLLKLNKQKELIQYIKQLN